MADPDERFDSSAATAARTEQHRAGFCEIRVETPDGVVAAGELTLAQRTHSFRFGANLFGLGKMARRHKSARAAAAVSTQAPPTYTEDLDELRRRAVRHLAEYDAIRSDGDLRYQEYFDRLFNLAVVPFYEGALSPERDVHRWHRLGVMMRWAHDRGIAVKGHPLIFHVPALLPGWLAEMDETAYWPWAAERIAQILGRFGDAVDVWDFINEPLDAPPPGVSPQAAIERVWHLTREHKPAGLLTLNFNQFEAFDPDRAMQTVELVQKLLERGVRPDVLGLQAHFGELTDATVTNIVRTMDAVAELGLPVHITETTFDSGRAAGVTASEERQARDTVEFYSYMFSRPELQALIWWDLADRHSHQEGGGLLRADLTPKPAYNALADLIRRQWMTDKTVAITDGAATFTGYYGEYDAEVQLPNGTTEYASFRLEPDARKPVVIAIGEAREDR